MLRRHKQSDADLVHQVLTGRREDFGALVERHLPATFAVAYGRTGNHSDAEDAAQEAFLRALKTLDRLREPAKFGPWLLTIARNVATDTLIARTRERNAGTPTPNEDDASWLPNMEQREMWSKLHEQIRQLDSEPREVLLLFYFAGKPTKEIATLLNLTHDAVRKRLQRARETLGIRLLEELQPEQKLQPVLKRRSATIAIAAIAAPVAWQTASAATVPTIAGIALGKWLAAAAVIALGLGGLLVATQQGKPSASPAQPEQLFDSRLEQRSHTSIAADDPASDASQPPVVSPSSIPNPTATTPMNLLHGRVVDAATGEGVQLGVMLASEDKPRAEFYYPCNETGAFEIDFSDFEYGTYLLSCRNYNYYPFVTALVHHSNEPFNVVILEVRELATISGRVLRADGSPAPNASIMRRELAGNIDTEGSANEDGNYEIHHEGGTMTLAARHGMLWSEETTFELTKDESTTHDFILAEAGEIRITLQTADGAAVENISNSVLATESITAPYLLAESAGHNEFLVKDLPYDVYTIVIRAPGYDPAEIRDIQLDERNPKATVRTTLRRGRSYELTVRVLDPSENPLPDAGVVLDLVTERLDAQGNVQAILRNSMGANGKNTDNNGEWSTSGLPAGAYLAYCNDAAGNGETYLSIPENRIATIQLAKHEYLQYMIQIVDALDDDKPLSPIDAQIFIVQDNGTIAEDSGAGAVVTGAGQETSRLGTIVEGMMVGTNHLIVVKEGYTAYIDTIVAKPTDDLVNLRAALGEGGTCEGSVRDANGAPRPLEPLYVFPELLWTFAAENWMDLNQDDGWKELGRTLGQRAQTDAGGIFTIDHLPQGRYVVALVDGTASAPVDVVPGAVTGPVEIIVE